MEQVFKVFKEGVTCDGPVTILRRNGSPFDEVAKRQFYLSLGYTITEIAKHKKK